MYLIQQKRFVIHRLSKLETINKIIFSNW